MRTSDLKILAVISMLVDHIGYVWGCFGALYYLPDKPMITGLCTALWGLVCYGLLDSSRMFCLATILPAVILCLYRGGQGLSGRKFKLFLLFLSGASRPAGAGFPALNGGCIKR